MLFNTLHKQKCVATDSKIKSLRPIRNQPQTWSTLSNRIGNDVNTSPIKYKIDKTGAPKKKQAKKMRIVSVNSLTGLKNLGASCHVVCVHNKMHYVVTNTHK